MNFPSPNRCPSPALGRRRPQVARPTGPIGAPKVARKSRDQQPGYYGTFYLTQLFGVLQTLEAHCRSS